MIKLKRLLSLHKPFAALGIGLLGQVNVISPFQIRTSTGQMTLAHCTEGHILCRSFALSWSECGYVFGSTSNAYPDLRSSNFSKEKKA